MKTPENDLFEIKVNLNGADQRVLVRLIDQKSAMFRVQVDGLPPSTDDGEDNLSLIGSDFPRHFEARSLGNLKAFLERHPDQTREVLAHGGVNFSNLLLARSVNLMVKESLDVEQAMGRALRIAEDMRSWLARTRAAADAARLAAAGQ
jgi:hypothetical protein